MRLPQCGWGGDAINGNYIPTNGDDEDVRRLNSNLIDPSGAAAHVSFQGMPQHRQEERNDICG
jgi:hypothetical protein